MSLFCNKYSYGTGSEYMVFCEPVACSKWLVVGGKWLVGFYSRLAISFELPVFPSRLYQFVNSSTCQPACSPAAASRIQISYKLCFLSRNTFSSVHSICLVNLCLRTIQSSLVQMGQLKSRQGSVCTNNSNTVPNSFFIRLPSSSTSLCASITFRYQGTVRWQSIWY